MGWWANFWDKLGYVFKKLFGWVTKLVQTVANGLTWLRIKVSIELADWLDTNSNWVIAIAVLIVGAYVLPKIAQFIAAAVEKISTWILLEYVKQTGIALEKIREMTLLQAMNDIAKIIFPEYRKAVDGLNAALSAIASELKLGAGYIHSYLAMARGLVSGTSAIFGLPPESMEYDWYVKAVEWSEKIEGRLWEYVQNPEKMFSDIIAEIMIPMQGTYTEAQQLELEEIYARIRRAEQIKEGVREIEQSLFNFVAGMPDEIKRVLDEKLGPYLRGIEDALETFDTEIYGRIVAVVDRIDKLQEDTKELEESVNNAMSDPLDFIDRAALMNARETKVLTDWAAEASLTGIAGMSAQELPDMLAALELAMKRHDTIRAVFNAPEPISYPPEQILIPAGAGRFGGETWFVGEY
jgi:hypothetical protein